MNRNRTRPIVLFRRAGLLATGAVLFSSCQGTMSLPGVSADISRRGIFVDFPLGGVEVSNDGVFIDAPGVDVNVHAR